MLTFEERLAIGRKEELRFIHWLDDRNITFTDIAALRLPFDILTYNYAIDVKLYSNYINDYYSIMHKSYHKWDNFSTKLTKIVVLISKDKEPIAVIVSDIPKYNVMKSKKSRISFPLSKAIPAENLWINV